MPIVTAPVAGFTGRVAGAAFVDGTAEVTNAAALAYFRRQGYRVESGRGSGPEPSPRMAAPAAPVLPAKPTVDDLKSYAKATGVDITGLTRKAEIAAAIEAAEGGGSEPTLVEPVNDGAPGPVADVEVEAGSSQATVTWSTPDDVTGFEVESTEHGGEDDDPVIDECTDTTFVVEELVDDVEHQFRVRAINEHGAGPWSEPVAATPTAE